MSANCRKTIELLAAFVDGALGADEEAALHAHMAGCPRCVEFVASYRGTSRVIRDATDAPIPPEVQERLLDFLRSRR